MAVEVKVRDEVTIKAVAVAVTAKVLETHCLAAGMVFLAGLCEGDCE